MFHHGANEGGGKSVGGGRERELTQKKCSASKRQAWRADRSRFCSAPFSLLSLYVILLLLRRGRSQRRRTCEHRCRRSICADAPTISSLPPGGLYPALSRRWAPVICVLRLPVGLTCPFTVSAHVTHQAGRRASTWKHEDCAASLLASICVPPRGRRNMCRPLRPDCAQRGI